MQPEQAPQTTFPDAPICPANLAFYRGQLAEYVMAAGDIDCDAARCPGPYAEPRQIFGHQLPELFDRQVCPIQVD